MDRGGVISGRYRVEKPLGRGGMGAVYHVFDTSAGVDLALKRLSNAASAKHVALFEREYHTLAGIKHPRVVEVYDYGTDRIGPYYTMELLRGEDMSRRAPVPWREVCQILRDVASALSLLHARRLIHRDLNPCNIWRTPDRGIKLIDFGALAAFGHVDHIAGTAPMIPPEALYGQALDQRSDLYALGALGYWLLTGVNAYPVNAVSQLKHAFRQPIRPIEPWIRGLNREDLEPPPPALNELILSLLSQDPMARPASAMEIVVRLTAIAELPPDASAPVAEAHLRSAAFVSRRAELDALQRALEASRNGEGGGTILVEGAAGMGRTRLLSEFALRAGLSGATVLHVAGEAHPEMGGTARAVAHKLFDVLPEQAQAAAQAHAPVLGHLSVTLRERLGLTSRDLAPMPQAPGEARMRVQAALQAWFLDVCREHPLTLLVDNVDRVDEASLGWLAGLSHQGRASGLLIVGTRERGRGSQVDVALRALERGGTRISLRAFTEAETLELLHSIFGSVPHLERLCGRVHQLSHGHPGHAMQIAEHLVRKGVISYVDASWVLPQELDATQLPESNVEALLARLESLSPQARAVARALSVVQGRLPLERCAAIVEQDRAALFAALSELTREGVLVGNAESYAFAHEVQRTALLAELDPAERARVHTRLAAALLQADRSSATVRLEAAVHGMLGEDPAQAPTGRYGALAVRAGLDVVLNRQHELGMAVPFLKTALELFKAGKRPPHELVGLISPLAVAAYYAERQLADQYGDEALDVLSRVLKLQLALRLRRYLGARLALYVALVVALFGFVLRLRNPRVPSFKDCVVLLFNGAAALAGTAGLCLDPKRAARYAQTLEPLSALGKNHAAHLTYTLAVNAAHTVSDHLHESGERWRPLLARLEDPKPIRALPDDVRRHFHAAALYGSGIVQCYRDGGSALEIADRLESFGMKLYEMSADQLRTVYYAMQGNTQLSEHYRQRVEMHAIARGNAWQVETWLPGPLMTLYLRTHDATGMRRQVQQLERLRKEIPSLEIYLTRSLGAYLLLSGRIKEALPYLEQGLNEDPQALIGWARGFGVMARALNALGEHARAKAVCEQALARMSEGDLDYCATNLGVAIEHARAEAALGNLQAAAEKLDALIDRYTSKEGPLTLGALHEARAEVAGRAGDAEARAYHLERMARWYRSTDVPALLRRCDQVELRDFGRAGDLLDEAPLQVQENTLLHRMRHGGTGDLTTLATWMLSQIAEAAGFSIGYLFVFQGTTLVQIASRGQGDAPEALRAWAEERLACMRDDEPKTTVLEGHDDVQDAAERLHLDGRTYRLHPLWSEHAYTQDVVGAVVTEASRLAGEILNNTLLRAVGTRLNTLLLHTPEPTSVPFTKTKV